MIERTILHNLVTDKEYVRRVVPYIREEYFKEPGAGALFAIIRDFVSKYNRAPSYLTLETELEASTLQEGPFNHACDLLDAIKGIKDEVSLTWLLEKTEAFCKDRAIYLALLESFSIYEGKDKKKRDKGAITDLMSKAMAVSFDTSIGHNYTADARSRFEYYHDESARVPFDVEMLNIVTKGGVPKKTLNIVLGGTNVGKTMFMCSVAAGNYMMGQNVLYLTMEISEEEIGRRIDANLLDVDIEEIESMPEDIYMRKIAAVEKRTVGKLVIKEYPTGGAGAGEFRSLLNELKIKQNFVPDVVFIDYINICKSTRFSGEAGTYTIVKAIAEELRGLAVEYDFACWTGTQVTRAGFNDNDMDITETSESWGVPQTADFMIALISDEDLEKMGQWLVKQLKNRYRRKTKQRRFFIGADQAKQRCYDVDQRAQTGLIENKAKKNDASKPTAGGVFDTNAA
jgi:replicative DNA helicase